MQRYTMLFIVVSALHVSSGVSAHHQELKNCICSIGACQTCVLLSLAWLSRNSDMPRHHMAIDTYRSFPGDNLAYTSVVRFAVQR
jgi:hypothetical protein